MRNGVVLMRSMALTVSEVGNGRLQSNPDGINIEGTGESKSDNYIQFVPKKEEKWITLS